MANSDQLDNARLRTFRDPPIGELQSTGSMLSLQSEHECGSMTVPCIIDSYPVQLEPEHSVTADPKDNGRKDQRHIDQQGNDPTDLAQETGDLALLHEYKQRESEQSESQRAANATKHISFDEGHQIDGTRAKPWNNRSLDSFLNRSDNHLRDIEQRWTAFKDRTVPGSDSAHIARERQKAFEKISTPLSELTGGKEKDYVEWRNKLLRKCLQHSRLWRGFMVNNAMEDNAMARRREPEPIDWDAYYAYRFPVPINPGPQVQGSDVVIASPDPTVPTIESGAPSSNAESSALEPRPAAWSYNIGRNLAVDAEIFNRMMVILERLDRRLGVHVTQNLLPTEDVAATNSQAPPPPRTNILRAAWNTIRNCLPRKSAVTPIAENASLPPQPRVSSPSASTKSLTSSSTSTMKPDCPDDVPLLKEVIDGKGGPARKVEKPQDLIMSSDEVSIMEKGKRIVKEVFCCGTCRSAVVNDESKQQN